MNVFKLLSRSSQPPQNAPSQRLPSAGAVANPQLFGHDEGKSIQESNRSRKRKRGQDAIATTTSLPADLDFFGAAKTEEPPSMANGKERKQKDKRSENDSDKKKEDVVEGGDAEVFDEDECKHILRSHKLKITVLEDFGAQEQIQAEKKKKKRKKDKLEGSKKKLDAKTNLFPQPLTSFAQLTQRYGISRRLADNLKEQGYTLPTEVQLGALPLLLRRSKGPPPAKEIAKDSSGAEFGGDVDLLTIAPTGSGKTIAFLIPITNALLSEKSQDVAEGPRAVIVAPTRELASQIVNEARKLSKGTSIRATLMKKGMEVVERSEEEVSASSPESLLAEAEEEGITSSSDEEQIVQQKKPKQRRAEKVKAAILVTTPLALLNALKRSEDEIADLSTVQHLVLDEADVLLDPLFREQTLSIWNACINPLLQIGLWSATMGSNIVALAINTLNERWTALSSSSLSPSRLPHRRLLIRLVVGLKDTAIPNISHQLTYAATEQGKLLGLRQLLHPTAAPTTGSAPSLRPPFLVFTQTIPRAIALHSELLYDIPPEAGGSSRIAVLHADLSSSARESIMTRFRRGEIWVLITTDLLARGVDFRGLNGVVNYDVPNSAAAYVHRVGRTGRAGREGGVAVTLYTQEDIPYVKLIANVIRASEKLRGKNDDEATVKQWLLDALPTPSKREKQQLKKKGVEARRAAKSEEGKNKMRISTKSGYERRIENRKRGAKAANKQRDSQEFRRIAEASESEFEGFE